MQFRYRILNNLHKLPSKFEAYALVSTEYAKGAKSKAL